MFYFLLVVIFEVAQWSVVDISGTSTQAYGEESACRHEFKLLTQL